MRWLVNSDRLHGVGPSQVLDLPFCGRGRRWGRRLIISSFNVEPIFHGHLGCAYVLADQEL